MRALAIVFALVSASSLLASDAGRALDASAIDGALTLERDAIVWIDEGEFTMGATSNDLHVAILLCQEEHDLAVAEGCAPQRFQHELRARRVHLPTFGIDRTEVTHAAWRRCVAAGRCVPSRIDAGDARIAQDAMPVSGITRAEAESYCEWASGRLPTEAEWEKAARGDSARRFPWGRFYHSRLANHGRPPLRADPSDGFRWAAPVGSFPDGASPYGVLDMAGNVYEWTSTAPSRADFAALGLETQDPAPYRIVRGGSWSHPAAALRVTHRALLLATDARVDVGVRCAYDPSESARPGAVEPIDGRMDLRTIGSPAPAAPVRARCALPSASSGSSTPAALESRGVAGYPPRRPRRIPCRPDSSLRSPRSSWASH